MSDDHDSRLQGINGGTDPATPPRFVVGIGASAGGLDPLVRFFDNLPERTGMAFVIVQHLSPDFRSLMDELLSRHTTLPIQLAEDGMPVEADHVYLIPAKKEMIISGGRLLLSERNRQQELTLPIDMFFRSLAQDCGDRAVAIVLSGGGSDGSRGICHVHDAGGFVLAQDLEERRRFRSRRSKERVRHRHFAAPLGAGQFQQGLVRHLHVTLVVHQHPEPGREAGPVPVRVPVAGRDPHCGRRPVKKRNK
jgi:hypothetical protein